MACGLRVTSSVLLRASSFTSCQALLVLSMGCLLVTYGHREDAQALAGTHTSASCTHTSARDRGRWSLAGSARLPALPGNYRSATPEAEARGRSSGVEP
jgi:hypothetical protein